MTKRLVLALMALLLVVTIVNAQQYGWVKVVHLATGLKAVEFVDSLHGWTAYGSDSIYKTTDGGTTWRAYSGSPMGIESISFSDTLHGWAVGEQASLGKIIRTTDGGITWTEQLAVQDRVYLGTAAQSIGKATASGYFFSSGVPDTGKLLRTTNGGANWVETTLPDSISKLAKVQFLDSLHGWITTGPNSVKHAVLRTTNGGNSWDTLPTPQGLVTISFLDTLIGWGAYEGYIFHTADGGMNWQQVGYIYDSDPYSSDNLHTRALTFIDSFNGWAFGGIFYRGISTEGIYRTTDGGINWIRESIGLTPDFGVADDGKMLDLQHGWAVCSDGSVLRYQMTTDVVEKLPDVPQAFSLYQNYPNPFNPSTNIEYELVHRVDVSIRVYDQLGKEVSTLVNQVQEPGVYRIRFTGASLPSGVYYYTLKASSFLKTMQMTLIK